MDVIIIHAFVLDCALSRLD